MAGSDRAPGGPLDTTEIIAIVNWRRYSRGEIQRPEWIKLMVADLIDDDELAALPVPTRYLFQGLLAIASRQDGFVPYDSRRIAGRLAMRPRDVTVGLGQLHSTHRVDVIPGSLQDRAGSLQLSLDSAHAGRSEPITLQGTQEGTLAARARAHTRAEQSREDLVLPAEQNVLGSSASALPSDTNLNGKSLAIVGRIIGLVCKGDEPSAAIVRAEAAGMPEAVLARALESYMGRRPRPANPAGYIVNAIRSIASEQGIVRERPTIERAPKL